VLRADRLEAQIAVLAARTIEGRKEIVGLDPRRADIILGGAIVLAQALAQLGATAIQVSARGLRWGLLYDRCQDLQGL
jgi:exopolyphosphatase/guanosine-5'-triphosphate,3'-diphosphate pyrophosphatase